MACIPYLKLGFKLCGNLGGMSYNITITVKDGTAAVSTSGEVPDGEWAVSGHEDAVTRQMGLTRRGADGRYVQQATSVHYKEAD